MDQPENSAQSVPDRGALAGRRFLVSWVLDALGASLVVVGLVAGMSPVDRVTLLVGGALSLELGGLRALSALGPIPELRRRAPRWSYLAGIAVATGYVALSLTVDPRVAELLSVSPEIKLVALGAAVAAGVLEELLFRAKLMDRLAKAGHGKVVQVLLSGLAFGAVHFWVFGGFGPALAAQMFTALLGVVLACVYLAAGRSVWPCALSHGLIDAVLEPALLLSFFVH